MSSGEGGGNETSPLLRLLRHTQVLNNFDHGATKAPIADFVERSGEFEGVTALQEIEQLRSLKRSVG